MTAEAEALYRQVLAADPTHIDALHFYGLLAYQTGRNDLAVDLIGRAIARNDRAAGLHGNLALALEGQGDMEAAVASYRRAIALDAQSPGYRINLGSALKDLGRLEEAEAACRQALALQPGHANAHNTLGNVLRDLGRLAEADASYARAVELRPDFVEAWYNLAISRAVQNRLEEAATAFRRSIALRPDVPAAHANLGRALWLLGRANEAIAAYRRAVDLDPRDAQSHNALGLALRTQGEYPAAAAACRKAVFVDPDFADAHNNLGVALHLAGALDEAAESYRRAIALLPAEAEPHYNLGLALQDQGLMAEAMAAYEKALACRSDYVEADSARVFCFNYRSDVDAEAVLEAHRQWDARHAAALGEGAPSRPNARDPQRRLRVGYVSADLWDHPVGRFLERVFAAHDGGAVETFLYANSVEDDAMTARLKASTDHWRNIVGQSDADVAGAVRRDGIDILVDLGGHTHRNRLLAFARKAAPVQVSWLGYPNTTGMGAMDYRIVDPITDPPGLADSWSQEKLVRLEGGFLCYGPPADAPEISAPPCLVAGSVTFGSFNNPPKLSDPTIAAWSRLLEAVPDSRLLLKGRPFADARARALLETRFAAHGIGPERLMLKAWIDTTGGHLGAYAQVDIALDPFPYNGTTTTCEALLMGVPVVTLMGDRHAGRVGTSLLTRVGLEQMIAPDEAAYVEIAARLAADPARLADLRQALRPRLLASSLCDGKRFTPALETAYRRMWKRWCAGEPAAALDIEAAAALKA